MKDGIQLVQLHLSDGHIAEAVTYKGLKLLRCFHQPLKHNVRVHLEHSGSGAPASPSSKHVRTRTINSTGTPLPVGHMVPCVANIEPPQGVWGHGRQGPHADDEARAGGHGRSGRDTDSRHEAGGASRCRAAVDVGWAVA